MSVKFQKETIRNGPMQGGPLQGGQMPGGNMPGGNLAGTRQGGDVGSKFAEGVVKKQTGYLAVSEGRGARGRS
jgi:hypothetical protein